MIRIWPWLEQWAGRIVLALGRRANDATLSQWLFDLSEERALSLPPDQGLRFLFRLDANLYPLTSRLSSALGGGIHSKHRHTGYHGFFTQRIHPGEKVLDLGCGPGLLAMDVARHCRASVVGVDISSKNIALSKERFGDDPVRFQVGDALNLALQEPFDVVILSNLLEHLPNRPHFLQRLQQQVGPCRMLIRVPLFDRDWRVPLKQELGVEWRLDPTHETEYTLESFLTEMAQAGLEVTEHQLRWGEIWATVHPRESSPP